MKGRFHLEGLQEAEKVSRERNRLADMYKSSQLSLAKQVVAVEPVQQVSVAVPGIIQASPEELAWRHRVITEGIAAGASLATLDSLRPLMNDPAGGFAAPGMSTMRQMCTPLRDFERLATSKALEKKWFVLEIDGTPHVGELLGGVVRYSDDNYVDTHQRLLAVLHLPKSPDATILGRKILELTKSCAPCILVFTFSLPCVSVDLLNLVGVLRDGAAVNGAALDLIHFNISTAVQIICHSHVISRIGERFHAPLLEDYLSALNMLFAHSAAVRSFSSSSSLLLPPPLSFPLRHLL